MGNATANAQEVAGFIAPRIPSPTKKELKKKGIALETEVQQLKTTLKRKDRTHKFQMTKMANRLTKADGKAHMLQEERKKWRSRTRMTMRASKDEKKDLINTIRAQEAPSEKFVRGLLDHANAVMEEAREVEEEAREVEARAMDLVDEAALSSSTALVNEKQLSGKRLRRERKLSAKAKESLGQRSKKAISKLKQDNAAALLDMKNKYDLSKTRSQRQLCHALRQIQKERTMWEVLSRGLNARVDEALSEVSDEKQRSRQLIQRQWDKALDNEIEMQSKIDDLNEYTFELGANLEVERKKAKEATLKYERAAKSLKDNIAKAKSHKVEGNELRDELAAISKMAAKQKELLEVYEARMPPRQMRKVWLKGKRGDVK